MRRNIVLIGDGRVADTAFDRHNLEEVAAFLVNNGIHLHVVQLEQRSPDGEIRFLVERTGGSIRYLYEPEGINPLVTAFRNTPAGRYWLTYRSTANPDFGRAYIGLSVEAELFVRSGRDEIGFFPPAEQ